MCQKLKKKKFLFTFIDLVTVPFLIGSSISHTQHHPYCTNNQQTNIFANNIEISLTLSPRFASNTNTLPLCPRVSLTIGIAGHCKIQQHICSEKVLPIGQFHQPMCFFFCYTFISSSLLMFPFFLENSTPFSHKRLCFASIIYIKTKMTHTRNELNYFYYSTFVKS